MRAAERKTPRWPSHMKRNEAKRKGAARKRPPSDRYDHRSISHAVRRACERAKVKAFSPYELRHLRAVELRERFGIEHVRAVLGHSAAAMSDHYSRAADKALATKVAREVG